MANELGVANFIANVDTVGKAVLVFLLILSIASWYLIVTKSLANWLEAKRAKEFLTKFWQHQSIDSLSGSLKQTKPDNAFAKLAAEGLTAMRNSNGYGAHKLAAAGGTSEFMTRAIRNGIDQESARSENGLTILASAGSASPYVGLFGTVWAIYHALVNIGLSGQGTLDKVAGPVGEALIMTAIGLAVAIPAVFAYNAFNRRNRMWLAKLDAFAHDLFVMLTVGNVADEKVKPELKSVGDVS
ncbi:MAG: MotA/TolQ/ExbB proton channel family protein [Methylotenera sp.]|uniref:MotA/TolQ/ExbB proton channel family protein n=1 Tax=Methylotenera sp. TaxID=2051956 RepID=UPI0017FD9D60|nr:MotA/TolQ/ExbB proton channel family protein [Methylotenera sp.]NOU25136.1 MotA/TolQ/ExbB proton channel family protein [Methylotenera sp.]